MGNHLNCKIDRGKLAPAGIEGYLIIVPGEEGNPSSVGGRMADRSKREFEVKCSLGKTMGFREQLDCTIRPGDGTSYLSVPEGPAEPKISTASGDMYLSKNDKNEVATVRFTCTATSWEEAFEKFFAGINPYFDYISYYADIPIALERATCHDKKNDVVVMDYRTPYAAVTVRAHEGKVCRRLAPVYSLYREAKTTFSNYYRFLCYFKIMEGIFGQLRPELMQSARCQNIHIDKRREIVPQHPELQRFKKEYVGKPIQAIFNDELATQYRKTVAHFVVEDRAALVPSDYRPTVEFASITLLSELCAREVIANQERYYSQFYESGGKLA